MPENVKKLVEAVAKSINETPSDKREIAARLAETYATGLAVGMELAAESKSEEKEG